LGLTNPRHLRISIDFSSIVSQFESGYFSGMSKFDQVLEMADTLSDGERENLIAILQARLRDEVGPRLSTT
jgi:hypothetical protein